MLPADWGNGMLDSIAGDIVTTRTKQFNEVVQKSGRMYTDGSGGPRWCQGKTSRSGVGVAAVCVTPYGDDRDYSIAALGGTHTAMAVAMCARRPARRSRGVSSIGRDVGTAGCLTCVRRRTTSTTV